MFYAGGGKGYGGRPEPGDVQYLYFPTDNEAGRYILTGAGADYEQIEAVTQQIVSGLKQEEALAKRGSSRTAARRARQQPESQLAAGSTAEPVTPESAPGTKSWTPPGKQGLSLSDGGIRLSTGGGVVLSLTGGGVLLKAKGNIQLDGEDMFLNGKNLDLEAKDYITLNCGASTVAILPGQIQMKAPDIYFQEDVKTLQEKMAQLAAQGPQEQTAETAGLSEEEAVEQILTELENAKKGLFNPFAADGAPLLRKGFDEFLYSQDMQDYFFTQIFGKHEEYLDYGQPKQLAYEHWLSNTFGKTTAQKIDDYLFSLDGLQSALDVAGFVLPPADLANAFISLCRGDLCRAGIDLVGAIPVLGDAYKSGKNLLKANKKIKALQYTYRALDSVENAAKSVRKAVNGLDLAINGKKALNVAEGVTDAARGLDQLGGSIKTLDGLTDGAAMLGKAQDGLKGAMHTADLAQAGKLAEHTADGIKGMQGAAEGSRYFYHGKEVSANLEVTYKILDANGNVAEVYTMAAKGSREMLMKQLGLAEISQVDDLLQYAGLNCIRR